MRRKNERVTDDADRVVKDIKRQTRRRFSTEEKIRIVLAGLRAEDGTAVLAMWRQRYTGQGRVLPETGDWFAFG